MKSKRQSALLTVTATALILTSCFTPTYFEEHGLVITPQGDFTYISGEYNEENNATGEFEVLAHISISEEPCAERAGYKTVTASVSCDMSGTDEGFRYASWQSAFDRYTGTSYEFDSSQLQEDSNMSGGVQFEYQGRTYDIDMEYGYDWDEENRIVSYEIYVTCPEDYDGTVFQIGYSDRAINETNAAIDYSERLYNIDELPGFDTNGHDYYYFSLSDR